MALAGIFLQLHLMTTSITPVIKRGQKRRNNGCIRN
jgi:hypothetical protein